MREFVGYKKGVNLGGWLSQCCHEKWHYENFIRENDIAAIASWGVDHVRLPIDYNVVQDNEGNLLKEGFIYIDRCIRWCEQHGLNLILDLHKTNGFAFDDDIEDFAFFSNAKLQDRFYALWEEFAKLYGKYKNKNSFELLNEITDLKYAETWNRIARNTISIIRRYAPDTYILLGGVWNNSIDALEFLEAPTDDKIIYNFHYYGPLAFTHQQAYWISTMAPDFTIDYPGSLDKYLEGSKKNLKDGMYMDLLQYNKDTIDIHFLELQLGKAAKVSRERNVPIYCGEYGVIDRVEASRAIPWFRDIHEVFEKYNIGRAIWSYKAMDFGIIEDNRDEIFRELITLL